jgi:4-hydroxybenzoate polyprenyltransferase
MDIAAAILLATVVLPFLIGWWVGHPVFAAAAFGALGLTVLIRQLQIDDGAPEAASVLWILVGSTISAAAAGYGGLRRERQRARRQEEGR